MKLTEFQNITPIANIPSILHHGIVSFEEASRISHRSVALQDVQDKRDKKRIPGGLALHEYANVYFHARNPMLSRRRSEAIYLCVLQVSVEILRIPGPIITDQNAASKYVKFMPPDCLGSLDLEYIFAMNWKHPESQVDEWRHSSAKCAEVLIPHRIPPNHLLGAYEVNDAAQKQLAEIGFPLPITIDANFFFH